MKYSLNKQFVRFFFLVSVLCVLCASVVNIPAQEWKTLKNGIEYAEVTKEISGLKVNMNLLRLDLTKVRLDVHHAMDSAIGTEKTSSIATRHGALAAINAGFFRLDSSNFGGDPSGILKIDHILLSEPTQQRCAIFIDNWDRETYVVFGRLATHSWYEINKRIISVDGTNRERKENDLIEYTPQLHPTTLTTPDGIEIVVRNGKVTTILDRTGSTRIPADGFVLSASGKRRDEILDWLVKGWLKIGSKIKGFTAVEQVDASAKELPPYGFEDITNGVPQLIKNGKIDITWEQEKAPKSFFETRHPRTAVAKLADGKFLMITVDGRSEASGGLGLQDLAEYLLSLGATDAMNLDGGGSTTMFVDGKVVNHPSDKEGERKVSDAILVTPRVKRPKK